MGLARVRFGKRVLACLMCSVVLAGVGGCNQAEPVGIERAYINENGELVLAYTDGQDQNLGVVVGADGKDGLDGKDGADGKDGSDGKDGADGKDGIDGVDGEDGADGKDGSVTVINKGSNIAYATSKGLQSAVSIVCGDSSGSGVIYTLDKVKGEAFLITNYHVIYDTGNRTANSISDDITVYLYGSEIASQGMKAEYVGGSAYYDIAVLHIRNSSLLQKSDAVAVTVSDSDKIVVGEAAIAIGNAKGEGTSASYGVVSVDSEHITLTSMENGKTSTQTARVIRVDTPVNPGNSGGGLYNESGELLGIVNAKIIDSSVENIGYAIPSNVAIYVADNIIDHCYGTDCKSVQRGMLGVSVQTQESYMKTEKETGHVYLCETVQIVEVTENSLVKGLVFEGDVLKSISFGDTAMEITRQYHVVDAMLNVREGDEITLGVIRDGEEVLVSVAMTKEHITSY